MKIAFFYMYTASKLGLSSTILQKLVMKSAFAIYVEALACLFISPTNASWHALQ